MCVIPEEYPIQYQGNSFNLGLTCWSFVKWPEHDKSKYEFYACDVLRKKSEHKTQGTQVNGFLSTETRYHDNSKQRPHRDLINLFAYKPNFSTKS